MEDLALASFIGVVGLALAHIQLRWKIQRMSESQSRLWGNFETLRSSINQVAATFFQGSRPRSRNNPPVKSPPPLNKKPE